MFVGHSWKDLFLFSSFCWLKCDIANETGLRIIWKCRVEGLSRVLAKEQNITKHGWHYPMGSQTESKWEWRKPAEHQI